MPRILLLNLVVLLLEWHICTLTYANTHQKESSSIGKAKNKKFLIVSVDNRELNPEVSANEYLSSTSVLTRDYAVYHGYDFVQVQDVLTDLVQEVKAKYPQHNDIPWTNNAKDAATAFHVGLKQFRAASWAKLPGIWYIVDTIGKDYEYLFYIDSDALLSPLHRNTSIEDKMNSWVGDTARGNSNPWDSDVVFFNNHPWRDDMPCAGTFIMKMSKADEIIREWWDYDMPSKNFKHFHEQDALWHMLDHPEYGFKMNDKTITIVNERQFPSPWKRFDDLWLCHIASYNYMMRTPILTQLLVVANLRSPHRFASAIYRVNNVKVHMLNVTEKMEMLSSKDPSRIKTFPAHDEKTQNSWYNAHVSSDKHTPLAPEVLYEGHLIRRKGEFYYVIDGKKRGFPNWETFTKMGFEANMAFIPDAQVVNMIPDGVGFSTDHLENLDAIISKRYIHPSMHKNNDPCEPNHELDRMITEEGYKSVMYIIAHNDDSKKIAHKYADCRDTWVHVTQINSTPFFETIMYRDVLAPRLAEWQDRDYIITGTYKSMEQKGETVEEIARLLAVAKRGNWDIIPFLRSGAKNMEFSLYFHRQPFKTAWDMLLKKLGYSEERIRAQDDMKGFFRNVFIIRPAVLKKLTEFMEKAILLGTTDTELVKVLSADSSYKEGTAEVALKIFNTTHYQLYPFVYERLPAFFMHAEGYKICHDKAGECQYNT